MTSSMVFVCSEKGLVNNMNTIQDLYYGRISPYEMSISAAPFKTYTTDGYHPTK